jgi:Raf kinase inhibitor-like YbhB/YbcL family protein
MYGCLRWSAIVDAVVLAALAVALAGTLLFAGASVSIAEEKPMTLTITSTAFAPEGAIPSLYTCEGKDISPPLAWNGAPAGTKSFALIVDDPDAPGGTWVHWVIYNIPPNTTTLPEGVAKSDTVAGGKQGVNDFGRVGYNGPMPPRGSKHRYFFKLYALKSELDLKPRATKSQLEAAMKSQILAQAELVGTYERR